MALTRQEMEDKLGRVFTPERTGSLVEVVDTVQQIEIRRAADTRDLKEGLTVLTEEVRKLTEAQTRTEQRVEELAEAQTRTEQRVGGLEVALERLVEAQARADQRMAELREAQARTEQRMAELTEAQARTEQRMAELIEAQASTEQEIKALVADQRQTELRLNELRGWQLEHSYHVKAYAYLGILLRRVRVVSVQEIEEDLQQHLSDQEIDDLIPLDLLGQGRPRRQPDAPEVWLAVEISAVVDRRDVERAQRRAAILQGAGYRAIPAVAGKGVTAGAETAAREGQVLLLQDGRSQFWEEALQAVLST